MNFVLYSSPHFERWDWRNPVEKGIGGSETHQIEVAERLAARGHNVASYAPVPFTGCRTHKGVLWRPFEDGLTLYDDGVVLLYRAPEDLDRLPRGARCWFIAQDSFYTTWTPARIAKCERIVALCQAQKRALEATHPEMVGRVCVSSNGIPSERVEEVVRFGYERIPTRLIYTSSPDRGLLQLLRILPRVREYVPSVELHCFYGFDNIDKIIARTPVNGFIENKKAIQAALTQPGVVWRGRVGQEELWKEWARAGVWAYPANFTETSCISCMEAQALGAIPVCNPIWAVGENVRYGVFVQGDVNDPTTQARYAGEIVRLLTQPGLQQQIRGPMQLFGLTHFSWERVVDQLEGWV